jgi:hypothetical protein
MLDLERIVRYVAVSLAFWDVVDPGDSFWIVATTRENFAVSMFLDSCLEFLDQFAGANSLG